MIFKKLMKKRLVVGSALGALLSVVIISGCAVDTGPGDGRDSDRATESQDISEREGEHSESRQEGDGGSEEHGTKGDGNSTGSDGGEETGEAAMSSPIIPLGQPWNGLLGGLAVSTQHDSATQAIHGSVRNTLSQTLCYVQAEPHLKSGTKTVGELGPEKLGHLKPGQEALSRLAVASEPRLAGVFYDGYVVHMEVFNCYGPGPVAHTEGKGAAGSGEHGGTGNETAGAGGEERGEIDTLALDETSDTVSRGVRLVLHYDAPSSSFKGTVKNTTDGVLGRVRVEVHLSNGTELGPTTPTDMAPGQVVTINLLAPSAPFTGWTAHAEVGEPGQEHRPDGEHGGSTVEPGRESGGEHGSGGERRGDE